jgi:tRNA modification GTPase
MLTGGTIVARASSAGPSPRAILRLSGSDTPGALAHILTKPIDTPGAHRAFIKLGSHDLACAVIRFAPGRSYTGEAGAEIQIPGSPHLIDRVIASLLEIENVRLANPGEFTARAYLSGRLTAEQAEGVMAVIAAHNDAELDASRKLLSGETGREYAQIADEIAACLALVESGIDFVEEEDVVAITRGELTRRLRALIRHLDTLTSDRAGREHRGAEARVVLAGPANAGKSTLFNALLGRERAVTSETAGTTRDAIAEPLDLGPGEATVTLIDIAGLDASLTRGSPIDARAQAMARETIESCDVVVLCDPGGAFEAPGLDLAGKSILRVRTKGDLATGEPTADLRVCALDGWNLQALKRAIADATLASSSAGADASAVLPRHARALTATRAHLETAHATVEAGTGETLNDPELTASALRVALDETAELAGEISPDDVLGRIFASFCIGK